jgi:diguanylate cyclase (GGDEF)-like protein
MWGFGLSEDEHRQISKAVGPGFHIRNFPDGGIPDGQEMNMNEKPSAAWIPRRVWEDIPEDRRDDYRSLESQRILIQEDAEDGLEMEEVLEQGFLTVVRTPLTRAKVQDAVFRAKEVSSMYSDIYRMSEEIMLERELLSRKTDQLMFLNRVLASASESLDPNVILHNAWDYLNMLLPVRQLHAVFWQHPEGTDSSDVQLFLGNRMSPENENAWVDRLLDTATTMGGGTVTGYEISRVNGTPRPGSDRSPNDGSVHVMPLKAGQDHFGALVLLCEDRVTLGKDQIETFKSAVNHLGLALRNALLFKEVKLRADRDGLTHIYNRRTFDERLVHELKRRQRYGHNLALLMVDLDHFKSINDSYGHQAGDEVLRRVGRILQESLRSTDLAARYGGEEFAVLLPHTSEKDACRLAERIRSSIESEVFMQDGEQFRVTASIGVASVEAGSLDRDGDLVLKADQALYEAKRNGRNMTVISRPEPVVQSCPTQ